MEVALSLHGNHVLQRAIEVSISESKRVGDLWSGRFTFWGWSDENIHDMTWDKMAMKGSVQEIQMITK